MRVATKRGTTLLKILRAVSLMVGLKMEGYMLNGGVLNRKDHCNDMGSHCLFPLDLDMYS